MTVNYKKLSLCLCAVGALTLASCSKEYDDSALSNRITNVEGRVTSLEERMNQFNTNVASLQTIVSAIQNNVSIRQVTPIGTTGYQLSFTDGKSITIYHGAKGDKGDTGATGAKGDKGDTGATGAKGDKGDTGAKGDKGDTGATGAKGEDGITPVIGVRESGGTYYWTINGEWLIDENRYLIRATGSKGDKGDTGATGSKGDKGDRGEQGIQGIQGEQGIQGVRGNDGITPKFKIERDYWYVSYDNGTSWTQLDKAKGDKGEKGEDGSAAASVGATVFQTITEDSNAVHITLASGGSLNIPKVGSMAINLSEGTGLGVVPNQTYSINYTLSGNITEDVRVRVLAQDGYKVRLSKTDDSHGVITLTTPSVITTSEVLIFVSNSERTILSSLVVDKPGSSSLSGTTSSSGGSVSGGSSATSGGSASGGATATVGTSVSSSVLRVVANSHIMPKAGGAASVVLYTNDTYRLSIPSSAQSWVHINTSAARAVVREETIALTIDENTGNAAREAVLSIVNSDGSIQESIIIFQMGAAVQAYHIHVARAGSLESLVKSIIDQKRLTEIKLTGTLNDYDYDFLRSMRQLVYIDLSEISNTTMPISAFESSNAKEVVLPNHLSAIPKKLFYKSKLTALEIPSTVQSIGESAFEETANLRGNIVIPSSVRTIEARAFYKSQFDRLLILNEGLESIGEMAFFDVRSAKGDLIIPNSVKTMGASAFGGYFDTYRGRQYGAGFTGKLVIGEGLEVIPLCAFQYAHFTKTLSLGSNVRAIGERAFVDVPFTGHLVIPDKVETIGESAFEGNKATSLTIGAGVKTIGDRALYGGENTYNYYNYYNYYYDKVYSRAMTPPSGSGYIGGGQGYMYTRLYVLPGAKAAYEANRSDWKKYKIEEVEF